MGRIGIPIVALALGCITGAAWAQSASPVGRWRTFDDQTGREQGVVRIAEHDGTLTGFIESTSDPADAERRCDLCDGERHDKPLLGLQIINGLHWDGETWSGGGILDPQTGRVYRCIIRIADSGRTLIVRGFLGLELLGRSQNWRRTP